jgi:hypothetical protein
VALTFPGGDICELYRNRALLILNRELDAKLDAIWGGQSRNA